jgi:hypothetical protein
MNGGVRAVNYGIRLLVDAVERLGGIEDAMHGFRSAFTKERL